MDKHKERRISLLASLLAKHYSSSDTPIACACTGLSDVCVDCSHWWELFLRKHSGQRVEKIMRLYLAALEATK